MKPHPAPHAIRTDPKVPRGGRGWRAGRLAAAVAVAGCLGGCAAAVREASRTAVPIIVSTGLGELATPQSQAQLKSIAASPAVQEAGYGVGLGIGRGILDEGVAFVGGSGSKSDEPPPAVGIAATTAGGSTAAPTANAPTTRMAAPATRAAAPATQAAASAAATTRPGAGGKGVAMLESTLTPVIGEMVRSAVTQGLGQAADERERVRLVAETAGDGFMTGVARAAERDGTPAVDRLLRQQVDPAVDDIVRNRLGPALNQLLVQQVAPAARQLVAECVRDTLEMPVRPENAPDVVANARNASIGASLGTHQAMIELGVLEPSGQFSAHTRLTIWGGTILLALLGLAALTLLVLRILLTLSTWRSARKDRRPT